MTFAVNVDICVGLVSSGVEFRVCRSTFLFAFLGC